MRKHLVISATLMLAAGMAFAGGASESTPSSKPSGPTEIEFFSLKPEAIDCYQGLVKKFNQENPDIHVTLTSTADAQTVFLTRVSTNSVPEVDYVFTTATYQEFMKEGLFMDLTDDPLEDLVSDGIKEITKVNGRLYCVPMTMSPSGIYYNKDLFAAHGYTMPDTYEKLIDLCKQMKKDGVQPFSFSDKDTHTIGQDAERLIGGNINKDVVKKFEAVGHKQTTWEKEPEMRKMAEVLLELRSYGNADHLGMSHEQKIADFVNQKSAMIMSGTWAATTINQGNPSFQYEMVPFPSIDGAEVTLSTSPDTCYAISASASPEKQAAAHKFIEFLLSKESVDTWLKTDLSPNMAKSTNYDVPIFAKVNNALNEGKVSLLPSMQLPAGYKVDWAVLIQQLFLDGDMDAFLKKTNNLTVDYYNK